MIEKTKYVRSQSLMQTNQFMTKTGLTQQKLKDVTSYDPETGYLTWRVATSNVVKVGDLVGNLDSLGYRDARVCGVRSRVHRLVWLYVYGEWPSGLIDHINTDKSDNRIVNLRIASARQNVQNVLKSKSTSTTGLLGVCFDSRNGRYYSLIREPGGKRKYLGRFETAQQAHEKYMKAWREMNPEVQR